MKGYLIPFEPGRKVAVGQEGFPLKGPVLYIPEKGAILYIISVRGDGEHSGIVPVAVDFFEKQDGFLHSLEDQIRGAYLNSSDPLHRAYNGKEFDFRTGLKEIDIPAERFDTIAAHAQQAYSHLHNMRSQGMDLIFDLEKYIIYVGSDSLFL